MFTSFVGNALHIIQLNFSSERDLPFVKIVKIDVLTEIASIDNVSAILGELR
jgi:hypothetical protein